MGKKIISRTTDDPIFDNSFNKGEIDYEIFGKVKVDRDFSDSRLNNYYQSYDYYRIVQLNNIISKIWNDSEWKNSYKIKQKIPKQNLSEIYNYIRNKIFDDTYTEIEMFVGIADFLDVNFKNLFDMILPKYKMLIVKELDNKYKIISKKRNRKLF